ncbi:MAG: HNH endonuclease [Planctomycetes bacterium]|nr:HNH endonuclease [Planctomycetota bacterium]
MCTTNTIVPPEGLLQLSAQDLHVLLLKLHRVHCAARRTFMEALLVLEEKRAYREMGSSHIYEYSARFFGYRRTATAELLRVGRALRELGELAGAFDKGDLPYSKLQAVTRIATKETQAEWLQFARASSIKSVDLEVRDALAKGRALPRKAGGGLPNLPVRWILEMTREEQELLRTALAKARRELGERLEGGPVSEKDALLYLARRMLETDPEGTPRGRTERDASIYTLVYASCPSCKRAHLKTPEGPVEVRPEVISRLEGEAEPAGASPQASEALRRKVLAAHGHRCARPGCGRRLGLHCHHIRPRSEGGATAPENLLALCPTCHSLVHQGLLDVFVDRSGEVRWRTKGEGVEVPWETRLLDLLKAPAAPESVQILNATDGERAKHVEDAVLALVEWCGMPRQAAVEAVGAALEALRQAGRAFTLDDLVNAALSLAKERKARGAR